MNSVVIPNPKQAYTKLPGLHSATHIEPQWVTAKLYCKSDYIRFPHITHSFMRKELSNIVYGQTVALYDVQKLNVAYGSAKSCRKGDISTSGARPPC